MHVVTFQFPIPSYPLKEHFHFITIVAAQKMCHEKKNSKMASPTVFH